MFFHLMPLALAALAPPLCYGQLVSNKIPLIIQRLLALACSLVAVNYWAAALGWEWAVPFLLCSLMLAGFAWVLILRRYEGFKTPYQWLCLGLAAAGLLFNLGGL